MFKSISFLIFTVLLSCANGNGQPELKNKGTQTTDILNFLADDKLMGRRTGEPGNNEAARYIAGKLKEYGLSYAPGLQSFFQNIPFVLEKPAEKYSLALNGITFDPVSDCLILQGKADFNDIPVVFAKYGLEDEETGKNDYEGLDVAGKIVIVLPGEPDNNQQAAVARASKKKRALAIKYKAAALLELYQMNIPWALFTNYFGRETLQIEDAAAGSKDQLIYGWIKDKGDFVKKELIAGKKEMTGSVSASGSTSIPKYSQNVVGVIEGTHPTLKKEYILLSAHYDHVGTGKKGGAVTSEDSIFNGARDNAMGTAAILHAAASLAKKKPQRSVLFLAVTGEEVGLLGSKYFAENPLIPLQDIIFNLNTDGAGYNSTKHVSVIGWGRTGVDSLISAAAKKVGLEVFKNPAAEQNLFDRSDNVSFAVKGIPALTFSPGFDAFDEEISKYYHRVDDEADTVDKTYLLKFSQSLAHLARLIADNPVLPKWVNGDKYEAAGLKLYRK
ncbi:MAG: M20/M25/M40 family metallo-hydrolase [Bacteroidetes bacterium]|nr:M20/M25/M40 family metallo-hydrolase [Bacteroidota bacterium]